VRFCSIPTVSQAPSLLQITSDLLSLGWLHRSQEFMGVFQWPTTQQTTPKPKTTRLTWAALLFHMCQRGDPCGCNQLVAQLRLISLTCVMLRWSFQNALRNWLVFLFLHGSLAG
jgi:hypothetical protein